MNLQHTPPSLLVLWRVTERCNLGCRFCGYDRSLARLRREVRPDTALAFGAVLGRYRRETGRRVLVSWLGGEPLLWAPLAEISAQYRQRHDLDLSLTTNATRLARPEVRAMLLQHYAEVTVSVDGDAPFHDSVRGQSGLHASLVKSLSALANAKRAAGAGPLLRANVILMRGNVESFPALCRELTRWGIEEITFNQLGGNERPEFFPDNRLLPQQVHLLRRELPPLRAELSRLGVVLRGSAQYLERMAASSLDSAIAPADCAPGQALLFIDEDSYVSPCSFTSRDYGVPLADIDTPAALAALPMRFAALRNGQRAPACADCHSTQHFGKFAAVTP